MSDCLEPERVSIRDIPDWARESWGLLWRRPAIFVAASLAYHLLALAAASMPWLSMLIAVLVCHIFLLVTIGFAEAADLGKSVGISRVYASVRRAILCLLLLTAAYLCIFIVAAVLAALLIGDVAGEGEAARQSLSALRWIGPGEVSFMIVYMGTIVTSSWFLAPLLALHELGTRDARALAKRAFDKNDIVILVASNVPFFVILVLASTVEASQVLSLGLLPLFAIYQYVGYRHVFLGRKQNRPRRAKTPARRVAPASSH
jgi:hypothetical protein